MTLFKRPKWWRLWKGDRKTQSAPKSEPILWDMTGVVKNLYPKPVMASDLLRLNELALKDDPHSVKAKLSVVDFAGNEIVGAIKDESDVAILAVPVRACLMGDARERGGERYGTYPQVHD